MQIEWMKVFCDVVRLANFSRGAKENDISQSSASQIVGMIESRVGTRLIDRSRRPLVLTPAGRVYYEGAKEIVERYRALEDRVRAESDQRFVAGRIRVAAIYSVGLHSLARPLARFHEEHPRAEVRLQYLHPEQVVEFVVEGHADLGIVSYPPRHPELTTVPWRSEPMVVATPPDHRLAKFDSVEIRALDGERLVHFAPDLAIRREVDKFLRRHHIQLEPVLEFDNIENIKAAVEEGAGIAILPEPSLTREARSGALRALPFKDAALERPITILRRAVQAPGAAVEKLLLTLLREAPEEPPARPGASPGAGAGPSPPP